jgi:hypothetical protein
VGAAGGAYADMVVTLYGKVTSDQHGWSLAVMMLAV